MPTSHTAPSSIKRTRVTRTRGCAATLLCVALFAGCGDDDSAAVVDGGLVDGPRLCMLDDDCDDGVFCNGRERCLRGASAGPDGCAPPAVAVCLPLQVCVEDDRQCVTDCTRGGDADVDGHLAISCGGDDCDDGEVTVNPEAPELCDGEGRDEDCDPATLAGAGVDGDRDADGAVRAQCCNAQPDGALLCGADCADSEPTIRPGATETCNMLDDDCDGRVDEEGATMFYADADGDRFGNAAVPAGMGCRAPAGAAIDATDCDDTNAAISPAAREVCDGDDESCDARIDEGCPTGAVSFAAGGVGPGTIGSGGIFFDDRCPAGEALVGIATASDVDGTLLRVGGLCAAIAVMADESSTPWSYGVALSVGARLSERGSAAVLSDARCPAGSLVVRIGAGLVLGCAPVDIERAADGYALLREVASGEIGPGGGGPTGRYVCPPLEIAIGLFGYAGAGAVAIDGIRCGAPTLAIRE